MDSAHRIRSTSVEAYNFRSGLGNFTAMSFDWYNNPDIWEPTKRMLGQYKSVKHLFTGDFYALSPYSTATNVWMAWQYDRPDLGEGLVQAFRRMESPEDSAVFKLRGLDEQAPYRVLNLDVNKSQEFTGHELMEEGLKLHVARQLGSILITYKKQH